MVRQAGVRNLNCAANESLNRAGDSNSILLRLVSRASSQMPEITRDNGPLIFISYARRDTARAELVQRTILAQGYSTWRDTRDLDPSADFSAEIESAIRRADFMVVCVTVDVSREDSFVRREIAYALQEDYRRRQLDPPRALDIIPVRFPGADLPLLISTWTALDVADTIPEETVGALLKARLKGTVPLNTSSRHARHAEPNAYLAKLHARVAEQLAQSVDQLIELRVDSRPDVQRQETVPGLRVSPALSSVSRRLRSAATEASRSFDNMEQAFNYCGGRMLLLGAPGSGKTTSLLALARTAAVECAWNAQAPVPVLADLSRWQEHEARRPGEPIVRWATHGQPVPGDRPMLLLLDGLDELGDPGKQREFLERLTQDYPSGQVLVTCRASDFAALGTATALHAMELAPLDDQQIRDYLGLAQSSAPGANNSVLQLARTPLALALLSLAAKYPAFDGTSVTNEVQLFDAFVAGRFAHEAARGMTLPFTESQVRSGLGHVAGALVRESFMGRWFEQKMLPDSLRGVADAFEDFCVHMNFLQRSGTAVFFWHLQFVHYFAAATLLSTLDDAQVRGDTDLEITLQSAISRLRTFAAPGLNARIRHYDALIQEEHRHLERLAGRSSLIDNLLFKIFGYAHMSREERRRVKRSAGLSYRRDCLAMLLPQAAAKARGTDT